VNAEILPRALWAVLIAGIGLLLYIGMNRILLARLRARRLGLESMRPGIPAILCFTPPYSQPCRTVQRPALAKLQERLGDCLQIVTVDATQRSDLADTWGVLSVPTTFLIDSNGRPRRVNHGLVSADNLLHQIEEIEQNLRYAELFHGALRNLHNLRNTR
jgi:thioredoxin-like negative regulator of GroEL